MSLNSAKTRVWTAADFKNSLELRDQPDAKLRMAILDDVFGGGFYEDVTYEDLTPSQKKLRGKLTSEKASMTLYQTKG